MLSPELAQTCPLCAPDKRACLTCENSLAIEICSAKTATKSRRARLLAHRDSQLDWLASGKRARLGRPTCDALMNSIILAKPASACAVFQLQDLRDDFCRIRIRIMVFRARC